MSSSRWVAMRSVSWGALRWRARDDRHACVSSDRVGSSRSITVGSPISARANASCCTIPVEHRSTRSAGSLTARARPSRAATRRTASVERSRGRRRRTGDSPVRRAAGKTIVPGQRDANEPTRLARAGDVTPDGHSTCGRRDRSCHATKDRRLPGAVRPAEVRAAPRARARDRGHVRPLFDRSAVPDTRQGVTCLAQGWARL